MNQRGIIIGPLIYVLAGLAVVAVFWRFVDWVGDARELEVRAEWSAENKRAQEEADHRARNVQGKIDAVQAAADMAERKASDADQKWRSAVRNAATKGVVLASCEPRAPVPTGTGTLAGSSPVDSGGVRLVLSSDFLRFADAAWSGPSGEPVFTTPAAVAGAAEPGASPSEVLDGYGTNAQRCSEDRRALATINAAIRAAHAAWELR